MAEQKEQSQKLGAIWNKMSQNGKEYMTGVLEIDGKKIEIIIHNVKEKNNDKSPDRLIFVREPMDKSKVPAKSGTQTASSQGATPFKKPAPKPPRQEDSIPAYSTEDDDIPF